MKTARISVGRKRETHSVREFVELAFGHVGRGIEWRGIGIEEAGVCRKTGKVVVRIDPRYFRPTEVDLLLGDPSKAKAKLGWTHETSVRELAREMVREDMRAMLTDPIAAYA